MHHHRTIGAIGAGVALAASLLTLGSASPAGAAATVNVATTGTDSGSCGAVGNECRTITQALANVDAGGTINVAAGTYAERVTIGKGVSIVGAGEGVTTLGSGTRLSTGPGVVYVGTAGNVSVTDLTVNGSSGGGEGGPSYGFYFDSQFSVAGATNRLTDVTVTGLGAGGNDYNIYCEDSNADLVVEDSSFSRADNNPLLIEGCTGAITLDGNTIEKTAGTAPSSAVFLMNNFGRVGTSPVTITGNSVIGGSVSVNTAFQGLAPGNFGSVTISGNQVTGGGVSVNNQATAGGAAAATISGAVVRGNLLQGTGTGNGVSITGQVTGTLVEGNTISGYPIGLRQAAAAAGHVPSGTVAVGNRIVANTTQASTPAGVALAAEDNWWGCNALATCGTFSGPVDASPNLVLSASASPTSVVAGGSSTVTASLASSSGGAAPAAFPNGAPVAFSSSLGSVTPASAALASAAAATSVSSATPGVATVSSTLDAQTVTAAVTFTAPPAPPAKVCKLIKITLGIPLLGIPPIVICI